MALSSATGHAKDGVYLAQKKRVVHTFGSSLWVRRYNLTPSFEQRLIQHYNIANWKSRAEILDYCIKVYDSRIGEYEKAISEKPEQGVVYNRDSRSAVALYEDQAKVRSAIR
jgi:hypothetical protein